MKFFPIRLNLGGTRFSPEIPVSLGTIPANTEVGWGLLFDSFILSNSTIDPGYYQLSDPQYNEVVDPAEQQHMVMMIRFSHKQSICGI
ncbi:MAG: hypothetical protein R3C26_24925 [Calditrichia bacterium]